MRYLIRSVVFFNTLRYECSYAVFYLNLFLYKVSITSAGKQGFIFAPSLCALLHVFMSYRDGSSCSVAVEEGEFLLYLHLNSS